MHVEVLSEKTRAAHPRSLATLPVPIPHRSSKSFAGPNPRLPAFRSPAVVRRRTRPAREGPAASPRAVGPPQPRIVSRSRSGPAPRRGTTSPGGPHHRATASPALPGAGGSRRSASRGAIRPRQVAREGGRGRGGGGGAAGCPPSALRAAGAAPRCRPSPLKSREQRELLAKEAAGAGCPGALFGAAVLLQTWQTEL